MSGKMEAFEAVAEAGDRMASSATKLNAAADLLAQAIMRFETTFAASSEANARLGEAAERLAMPHKLIDLVERIAVALETLVAQEQRAAASAPKPRMVGNQEIGFIGGER
jgi:hypothetical protein